VESAFVELDAGEVGFRRTWVRPGRCRDAKSWRERGLDGVLTRGRGGFCRGLYYSMGFRVVKVSVYWWDRWPGSARLWPPLQMQTDVWRRVVVGSVDDEWPGGGW